MAEQLADRLDGLTYADTIGIAKAAILSAFETESPISGPTLHNITIGDARLSRDDTDIAVTQLSASKIMHLTSVGYILYV